MWRWLPLSLGAVLTFAALPAGAVEDTFILPEAGERHAALASLSDQVLAAHARRQVTLTDSNLAHLHVTAGHSSDAVASIEAMIEQARGDGDETRAQRWMPYLVYARAALADGAPGSAYAEAFRAVFEPLDDLQAQRTASWFVADAPRARETLAGSLAALQGRTEVSLEEALDLARRQAFVEVFEASATLSPALIAQDESRRYLIDDQVLIRTPSGATLSAVVVRGREAVAAQPAAMLFTIYTDPVANRAIALRAASRGYVGVVVDARGKRLSEDDIRPYETEADDATAAIEWIAAQPWSDGRVGMYGGSYSGFAAWAATKRMPAALRTIVPYVAAIPGLGLPMENNVFLSANYAWPFFVAGSRLLETETYSDRARWQALPEAWYSSGRAYREIDQVDGTPNPWLQRWLSHPSYDAYWQAMVPQGDEYARIDIPVLTITGYYDDGQISALHFFNEHLRHRPDAEHYLLIGPYDHFGAQASSKQQSLRGYAIDPSAQFDTEEVTFEWLDHVLRGAARPQLLRDRVNYQLMGADEWRHVASLGADVTVTDFFLSGHAAEGLHLRREAPPGRAWLTQHVDLADRSTRQHGYYPDPIVLERLESGSGFAFASAPFEAATDVVGTFSGELMVRTNKQDFDFSVSLYEVRPDGSAMQLSYYVGRASYAHDMSRRQRLVPGEWTSLPFARTRMTGRRMPAGSRLLAVVDVLKDPMHQVNMGTGGDVSDESVADAGAPLRVEWRNDSVLRVPLRAAEP